jgi:hypothetical protein
LSSGQEANALVFILVAHSFRRTVDLVWLLFASIVRELVALAFLSFIRLKGNLSILFHKVNLD